MDGSDATLKRMTSVRDSQGPESAGYSYQSRIQQQQQQQQQDYQSQLSQQQHAQQHYPPQQPQQPSLPATNLGASNFSLGASSTSLLAHMIPQNNWSRLALFWSLFQFLGLLSLESIALNQHLGEFWDLRTLNDTMGAFNPDLSNLGFIVANERAITVYMGLFLVAQFFQLYLAFDAIMTSSVIQLFATTGFNLSTLAYSILQYSQSSRITSTDQLGQPLSDYLDFIGFVRHRGKVAEIFVIIFSLFFFGGWVFVSTKLYNIFGWSIYKNMSADTEFRRRLYIYHIYMMLLKLDIFFMLGFACQYVILAVYYAGNLVLWTNVIIMIPSVLILLALAYYSIKNENKITMIVLLVLLTGGIGYLFSRLWDIYGNPDDAWRYVASKGSLTVFIIMTAVLAIATWVVAVMCLLNFGKGLMEKLKESKQAQHSQAMGIRNFAVAT